MTCHSQKINILLENTASALKDQLQPSGLFTGSLSSSALATAVTAFAFKTLDQKKYQTQIDRALYWLTQNTSQNAWGDSPDSPPNISTTLLSIAALNIDPQKYKKTIEDANQWLLTKIPSLTPQHIAETLQNIYGRDKTFSAPILSMCALAGILGKKEHAFNYIKPLPFELAMLPRKMFKWARLPVVSYALPALIAIGQLHYHYKKPLCPVKKLLRRAAIKPANKLLCKIQPPNGGFLEAPPLTAFVAMSLASIGQKQSPAVLKCADFLTESIRPDGSLPIDSDLACWLTSLSVSALHDADALRKKMSEKQCQKIAEKLIFARHKKNHPYTASQKGGWGWTNLPGSVPDADDTAAALCALKCLKNYTNQKELIRVVNEALTWLMNLANKDGGIPTFCKGWNRFDFDKSAAGITAHSILAASLWQEQCTRKMQKKITPFIQNASAFLKKTQDKTGSWAMLWFGSQYTCENKNPVFSTARIISYLARLNEKNYTLLADNIDNAARFLLDNQNHDGSWGPRINKPSSIEETAQSITALALVTKKTKDTRLNQKIYPALENALNYLHEMQKKQTLLTPSPIGLYFAKLWYSEKLYPMIFLTEALANLKKMPL